MYTSYTGEQEANMSMYKLTLHFKYSSLSAAKWQKGLDEKR